MPVTKREVTIIRKMKDVLNSPEKWTQGQIARTADGHLVPIGDENATCFCLVGARRKAGVYSSIRTFELFRPIMKEYFKCGKSIVDWNDAPERTYEDVVELLNKAEEYYIAR